MYEPTDDNVYGAIERQLRDEKFEVLHLFRYNRGDWGDDGGYLIAVSKKNGKIYLQIVAVNYNATTDSNVLDENYPTLLDGSEDANKIADFIVCESMEDVQSKLEEFIDFLDKAHIEQEENDCYCFEGGYLSDEEELPAEFKELSPSYLNMIAVCLFAYYESKSNKPVWQDRPAILNLLNTPYTPDYTDPEEYTEDDE